MGRDGNSFPNNSRDFSAKIACVLGFLGSLLPYSTPAGDTGLVNLARLTHSSTPCA
jgi:hypothetical protein